LYAKENVMPMDELLQLAQDARDAVTSLSEAVDFAQNGEGQTDEVPLAFDVLKDHLDALLEKLKLEEQAGEWADELIDGQTDRLVGALLALHRRATAAGTVSLAEVRAACLAAGIRKDALDPDARDDEAASSRWWATR
jgi:hypothetical protein